MLIVVCGSILLSTIVLPPLLSSSEVLQSHVRLACLVGVALGAMIGKASKNWPHWLRWLLGISGALAVLVSIVLATVLLTIPEPGFVKSFPDAKPLRDFVQRFPQYINRIVGGVVGIAVLSLIGIASSLVKLGPILPVTAKRPNPAMSWVIVSTIVAVVVASLVVVVTYIPIWAVRLFFGVFAFVFLWVFLKWHVFFYRALVTSLLGTWGIAKFGLLVVAADTSYGTYVFEIGERLDASYDIAVAIIASGALGLDFLMRREMSRSESESGRSRKQ